MSQENALPTADELEVVTNIDLTISQMPRLKTLEGEAITMVVTKGRNYSMRIDDLAASLSASVVSGSDLEKKADKTAVVDLTDRVDTLERRSATKLEVQTLGAEVEDLSAKTVRRVQFADLEQRVNAVEQRSAVNEEGITRLKEQVASQNGRIATQDTTIEQIRLGTVATDLKVAETGQLAEVADANAKRAQSDITALKGRVDTHGTQISSLQGSRDLHAQQIGVHTTDIAVLKAANTRIDQSVTAIDLRVTKVEARLGDFALQADLQDLTAAVRELEEEHHVVVGQIDAIKVVDIRQDAAIAAIQQTHAADMASLNLRLASLQEQIDVLKRKVDEMGGPDASFFPEFTHLATVGNINPNNGQRNVSIQSLIRDTKGVAMDTVILHLEIDQGSGWGRVDSTVFSFLEGGATTSKEMEIAPGATIKYRQVIGDKWRPGWIRHEQEFTFTAI